MAKAAYRGQRWQALRALAIEVYGPWCHICGFEIDTSLKSGRWMYALDHLDPVVRHGSAIPPIERVRPSHFGCNSKKKAKASIKVRPQSRRW